MIMEDKWEMSEFYINKEITIKTVINIHFYIKSNAL